MSISRYQQNRWLALLEANVDHVQLLDGSNTPVSAAVSASFGRQGLLLTNLAQITLSGAGAVSLALLQGGTVLAKIPWAGGAADPGQMAYSLGAS